MNNNPFKKLTLYKIKKTIPKKKVNKNDNKKEYKKFAKSLRKSNKNYLVHYYSKSLNKTNIKKESQISSFYDIEEEIEGLDHPKPLISDSEEDLEDLKTQFKKIMEHRNNLIAYFENKENQGLNLNKMHKIDNSKYEETLYIDNDKKILNINNKNKSPLQNNDKSNMIIPKRITSQIKGQINNKINNYNIISNNNTEKNKKSKKEKHIKINDNIFEYESFNNLKEKKYSDLSTNIRNDEIIKNDNYNYINKKKDIINNKQNNKDAKNKQNLQINTSYIYKSEKEYENYISKNIIKEDYENNFIKEKNRISKNISRKKKVEKIKPIKIVNINYLNPKEETKHLQSINNESNNILNSSKIKSSNIKLTDSQIIKNIFENQSETQKNKRKNYGKKSFIEDGKINNQTTSIIICKKKNLKQIPKFNIIPGLIYDNDCKPINQTPSSNQCNYVKIGKELKIPQSFSRKIKDKQMYLNILKKFGINKSSNINDLSLSKNSFDKKYRNSAINGNRAIYIEGLDKKVSPFN